jgi:rhamnulokinase
MPEQRFAAVDLGAQSGRVAVGRFDGARLELEVAHRFANRPLWLPDGLHWNVPQLFADTLEGLGRAAAGRRLAGVGIDSWGCDYALLDRGGRILGLPYHYREPARASQAVIDRAFELVDRHELYARTGIQTIPINTVFQLVSEADRPAVAGAARIALIPDLFGLWLTGALHNELTAASTTGLLEARGERWAVDLIERFGLPAAPFAGEVVQPGAELGPILDAHAPAGRAVGSIVRTVAGHDTASAFVATTLLGPGTAVLSSGTWSLLGVELEEPALGPEAEAFNLTNERGVDRTVRLLRNVMGMWLIEEYRRECGDSALDYAELFAAAATARPEVPLFDPDADSLLHPGAMAERIAVLCRDAGQAPPVGRGELVRSILVSLACKYRLVVEWLESVSGQRIERLQIVGGGSHNRLLCQITADVLGRDVLAGPAEATLLGNLVVQLAATGELSTLAQMRELSGRSVALEHFAPSAGGAGEATYQRFLEVTGLAVGGRATATVETT